MVVEYGILRTKMESRNTGNKISFDKTTVFAIFSAKYR
jgi:hypothetical protein